MGLLQYYKKYNPMLCYLEKITIVIYFNVFKSLNNWYISQICFC